MGKKPWDKELRIRGVQQRGENSYFFTVNLGLGPDNKYQRKTKTYKVEVKLSESKLKEHLTSEYLKFKNKVLSGNFITPQKMIFDDFVEVWKRDHISTLSGTTIASRLSNLRHHITPKIGFRGMDQINTVMINELIRNLTSEDKKGNKTATSDYTKVNIYKTLNSIFSNAKKWMVIKNNPMDGVSKPKVKSNKGKGVNVYNVEEAHTLLSMAEDEPPLWRIFIILALTCGLRRGELLGLEWEAIDLDKGIIDVSQSIVLGDSGAIVKEPKSNSSRLVSVPNSVLLDLKEYKEHWNNERKNLGSKWEEESREWLFCNTKGNHFYPTTPTTWWSRFTKRSQIRHIRLHDLRHTSATLLITQGVHAKIISDRLGHSQIGITMDTYGHALRSADKSAADSFDNLLFKTNVVNE